MYAQQTRSTKHAQEMRKRGGKYIQGLRKAAGLTQKEVADKTGIGYYTLISQIENGGTRLPPDRYERFAEVLGVSSAVFAKEMLRFYDPFVHKALFGAEAKKESANL